MAGMFCAAPNAASASGSDPPSRNENAERACNSTYFAGSVIHPFDKPLAGAQVLKHPVEAGGSGEVQFHVPFIALPFAAFVPPRAGGAPGAGHARYLISR